MEAVCVYSGCVCCITWLSHDYCMTITCSPQELRERVLRGKYRIPFYMSTGKYCVLCHTRIRSRCGSLLGCTCSCMPVDIWILAVCPSGLFRLWKLAEEVLGTQPCKESNFRGKHTWGEGGKETTSRYFIDMQQSVGQICVICPALPSLPPSDCLFRW